MPERHRRLLCVTAILALAASPALAQSCGGTDAAAAGGTLVDTSMEAMSCVTLYDAAVTQQGGVQAAYDEGAVVGLTTNTYDSLDRLVTSTDIAGTTHYTYNAYDELSEVTDPNGHATNYMYDAVGNLTEVSGPAGTTMYHYDSHDRLMSSTGVLDITSTMYDTNGNLTQIIEPGPQTYDYGYDAQDRITTVTDPLGNVTTTTYDTFGNDIQTTDASLNTTT